MVEKASGGRQLPQGFWVKPYLDLVEEGARDRMRRPPCMHSHHKSTVQPQQLRRRKLVGASGSEYSVHIGSHSLTSVRNLLYKFLSELSLRKLNYNSRPLFRFACNIGSGLFLILHQINIVQGQRQRDRGFSPTLSSTSYIQGPLLHVPRHRKGVRSALPTGALLETPEVYSPLY
jgi:hypothetical protein